MREESKALPQVKVDAQRHLRRRGGKCVVKSLGWMRICSESSPYTRTEAKYGMLSLRNWIVPIPASSPFAAARKSSRVANPVPSTGGYPAASASSIQCSTIGRLAAAPSKCTQVVVRLLEVNVYAQ